MSQGPVICSNCGDETDTPRRGCCPRCYSRWLRCPPEAVEQKFKGLLQAARALDRLCEKWAAA